jgi:hypothetical protein
MPMMHIRTATSTPGRVDRADVRTTFDVTGRSWLVCGPVRAGPVALLFAVGAAIPDGAVMTARSLGVG